MTDYDYEADAAYEDRERTPDFSKRLDVTPLATDGPKSTLAVRIHGRDIERLRVLAERAGEGVTQMCRRWLLERAAAEEIGGADAEEISRSLRRLISDAEVLRTQMTANGLPLPPR